MKQSISTLQNWFRTALKPTQNQFWDLFDSFWHKDENIPIAHVEGLTELLADLPSEEQLAALDTVAPVVLNVAGTGVYSVGAGKLMEVVVVDSVAGGSVKVGTSVGGGQVIDDAVSAGVPGVFRVDFYSKNAGSVYFTGTFTVKIYLR